MSKNISCDVAVIGAGAAGLSAAAEAAKAGKCVYAVDREKTPGGILNQCIHNGFGLRYFKEELTGPEYALRAAAIARDAGVHLLLNTMVTDVGKLPDRTFDILCFSPEDGVIHLHAKAIVLAMGCRERNRGNIATPGERPAGIFTAGSAQKLLNTSGMLPGKTAVIVGSGDIGLIMARRLSWSGIKVKAVFEIMPTPSGLTRNIVQCLNDFHIPLYLEHAVVNIAGKERVEYIEAAPLKEKVPQLEKKFRVDCDTVLFSVGLIPSNELSQKIGVEINPATGGSFVNEDCETNVPGVFAGGNVLHVHDLVDFVSEESARAGRAAAAWCDRGNTPVRRFAVKAGNNLKYAIPNFYQAQKETQFLFRSTVSCEKARLCLKRGGEIIWSKNCLFVRPAEMLSALVPADTLHAGGDLEFVLETKREEQR